MYYRISPSVNPKVIGNVNSQAEHAHYPVNLDHLNLFKRYYLKRAENPEEVISATPILVKKALLTDLIGGSALGNGIQLMISNKTKEILSFENHHGLQFFPMSIIFKDIKLNNYWLSSPYEFDMEQIDYIKSTIEVQGLGGQTLHEIKINDYNHFETVRESLILPERIYIRKVVLKKYLKMNLIILSWVSGGVGYYVSEFLREELEDAGCTGIEFEPVEQA